MNKLFLTLSLSFFAVAAIAKTTTTLTINSNDGSKDPYNIEKIKSITFDGDKMIVNGTNGTANEYNIDAIEIMTFATITGIEGVYDFELEDNLEISVNKGILSATQPDTLLNLRIYTINGQMVHSAEADSELTYSLADLPSGVYIITINNKALKFIR